MLFLQLLIAASVLLAVSAWIMPNQYRHSYNYNKVPRSAVTVGKYVKDNRRATQLFDNGNEMKESSMSIDELKAELDLRGVDYSDCLSKKELVNRLIESRVLGKANPDVVDKFNTADKIDLDEIDDDTMSKVVAQDGGLPGGLSAEMMKALSSDKDIMNMLKDPKMQDIMKAVMTGGPDAIKRYMADPDALMLLERLSKTMNKITDKK